MITVSAATVVTSLLLLADGPSGTRGQQDALQVWVAPDTVRVNPETGKYFEDHRGLDQEQPAGNYRVHNSVWDAASGRVSLWSARNEFVSFQVVVGSGQPIQGIRLTLDGLAGAAGIPGASSASSSAGSAPNGRCGSTATSCGPAARRRR